MCFSSIPNTLLLEGMYDPDIGADRHDSQAEGVALEILDPYVLLTRPQSLLLPVVLANLAAQPSAAVSRLVLAAEALAHPKPVSSLPPSRTARPATWTRSPEEQWRDHVFPGGRFRNTE